MGFAFSTPEKKGNVPGFDVNNQWKLLPICSDCALYLNAGKNFVEKYLNFKEFGLNYYVIPNFVFLIVNEASSSSLLPLLREATLGLRQDTLIPLKPFGRK